MDFLTILCPDCGAEIDHVREYGRASYVTRMYVYPNGDTDSSDTDYDDHSADSYECPDCGHVLGHSGTDIVDLFRSSQDPSPPEPPEPDPLDAFLSPRIISNRIIPSISPIRFITEEVDDEAAHDAGLWHTS